MKTAATRMRGSNTTSSSCRRRAMLRRITNRRATKWRFSRPLPQAAAGHAERPTGCGKTRFLEHMAFQLKRPLVTVSCHEDSRVPIWSGASCSKAAPRYGRTARSRAP